MKTNVFKTGSLFTVILLGYFLIMGEYYGLGLGRPATSAQEATQWVYMAYLAAVKEQDGAAMSLGNVSSFLDIYIEYDLAHGNIDEAFAQELIDQFVIKLRMHPVFSSITITGIT